MENEPAEVEEKPFKHQDRTGTTEDGEGLTRQQTEDPASDRRAQETLQHPLDKKTGKDSGLYSERNTRRSTDRPRLQNPGPHLHVFRGVPQQAPEGDGVRHGPQVNEQNGRQGLDVKRVGEVTDEERRFSFDVEHETPAKPGDRQTRGASLSALWNIKLNVNRHFEHVHIFTPVLRCWVNKSSVLVLKPLNCCSKVVLFR